MGKILPEMAAYTSGDDLLQKERYADIAFLDVEMPGRSGIHVGARLKELNHKIKVFHVRISSASSVSCSGLPVRFTKS